MPDADQSGQGPDPPDIQQRYRISIILFATLALVGTLVLSGLLVVAVQLARVENDIGALKDRTLPRLVKLSQLSQEAAASIAIAPALSTNPTRFEFETLLARMRDKAGSQETLIAEISALLSDENAVDNLRTNSGLLAENQGDLTNVVRRQIDVRRRLERHIDSLRRMVRSVHDAEAGPPGNLRLQRLQLATTIQNMTGMLLDTNRARFSRNRRDVQSRVDDLKRLMTGIKPESGPEPKNDPVIAAFLDYWDVQAANIFQDKSSQLTNDFRIKALVEENSLIANRLLSSASSEFAHASADLGGQTQKVSRTTRYNLAVIVISLTILAGGSVLLWLIIRSRVLQRLDRIRDALQTYSQGRGREAADRASDEIGEISRALSGYMDVIDKREAELWTQTDSLRKLSAKLSKYLSPQVYESIFSGQQDVKVSSTRKKLTVFFSDIVGFTDTADHMESEELTALLNSYLTEMTQIALDHGATIDKYIGDAIMIFFGDPETRGFREDALVCAEMAIAMRDRLRVLGVDWRKAGIESPLDCRIGIHTGYCTVGNFGSESRMDYTIIGGTVNLASRLESAAKPSQILISYETFAHIRDAIECRKMGHMNVKGIAHPVATYEILRLKGSGITGGDRMHQSGPGYTVDLDLAAMDAAERENAEGALRKSLATLKRRANSDQ